ncbi:MAG: RNA polymerase sigma factor [Ferruginibacter sp.]
MIKEGKEIEGLINGCKKDDRRCQEQLYRSYYKAMMNLCLRYTQNERDAMEVLNTGFYKVFKNISSYQPLKGSFYTWASTIIIHTCIDFINAGKRVSNKMELSAATEIAIPSEVISKMSSLELLHFLKELSPVTRSVFNLFIVEGYSHKEIGQLLHIPEGTSKWHLSEARKHLQKMIQLNK